MDTFRICAFGCFFAVIPQAVWSMELLGDDHLSSAIAQDGISILFVPEKDITATLAWTDTDGLQNYNQSGTVIFGDGSATDSFSLSKGLYEFTVDVDGGLKSNSEDAQVNLGVKLPQNFKISTGSIYVAGKQRSDIDAMTVGNYSNKTKIMNNMEIEINGLEMNVQFGRQLQGSLVSIQGKINNGIKVSKLDLINDIQNSNDIGIGLSNIVVTDTNDLNFTFNGARVDISKNGIFIQTSPNKLIDVKADDMKFGNLQSASSIGAVALVGLDVGSKAILISGH